MTCQQKRLKGVSFPHTIQSLPHVLKGNDPFALSLENAATEAAASGRLEWLKRILPRVIQDHDDVACSAIDTAAANNQAISEPRKPCANALLKAIEGGHLNAVYEYGDVPLSHEDAEYKVLLTVIRRGYLDIVKFIIDKRGLELLNYAEGDDSFDCQLVVAAQLGTEEILDYVYSFFLELVCDDISYGPTLGAAAGAGRLEWVKMLYKRHEIAESELESAFACAAGNNHLDVVRFLQSRKDFNISFVDKAFVNSAGRGQMDTVKYLCSIEGYETSASAFNKAFVDAAGGG